MTLTGRAQLVLGIARRIKDEQAQGWPVDPSRLDWADFILAANKAPNLTPERAMA